MKLTRYALTIPYYINAFNNPKNNEKYRPDKDIKDDQEFIKNGFDESEHSKFFYKIP